MTTGTVEQRSLLGIDLGTSSVKAVVTDEHGTVLAQSQSPYPVRNPRPGWSETDPRDWLSATAVAVRDAVRGSGTAPVAVGLSGQMHGVVPTGADGDPTRPAMLWADSRAVPQLATYDGLPDPARARLGNPLSPGMAGPMLAWLAANEQDSYARTRWALQPKDWLRLQLTGEVAAEPSDASATLLYDLVGDCWDAAVVDALGVDPELLPPLLPRSSSPAGQLTGAVAQTLGLAAGIPVVAGAADTAAAALGSALVDAGDAQLTIGTGAQVVTPVDALPAVLDPAPTTHLYRAATDAGWYRMGAVLSAGLTLGWVRQVLGATWAELFATAALPPAADDPCFVPHLNGERTPYLDPDLRGAWTGLSPRHDRARLLRAALEGVACAVADAVDAVVAQHPGIGELRLAGGGSTDPAWRQLLADVVAHPLRPVEVAAASGRGAAVLAGHAAGGEAGLVGPATGARAEVTLPQDSLAEHYRERRGAFADQVRALQVSRPPPQASTPPDPPHDADPRHEHQARHDRGGLRSGARSPSTEVVSTP